jgi:hypothetical protein
LKLRWAGVGIGLVALAMFIYVGSQDIESVNVVVDIMGLVAFVSPALVGAYLVWRLPGNAVGWVLAAFGLTFTLGVIGETVAVTNSPFASWGAWLASWLWAASTFALLVLLPLRFPDGKLPSSRFRWVTPLALIGLGMVVFGNAFKSSLLVPIPGGEVAVPLPLALDLPMAVFDVSAFIGMGLLLAGVGGAVVSSVMRFRRSAGVERQQMKVFAAALVFSVTGMALNLFLYEMGNEGAANLVFATLVLVLVASISLAVLRYRLYDFDRVVSRTVSYALLVLILGSIYVVGAVWLPTRITGQQSPLFVAGSTLAVAGLFTPIRRLVMRWVGRRFNRSAYDAQRVTEAFAARLRDPVDADRLAADWADVVSGTLEPSRVGVWVKNQRVR